MTTFESFLEETKKSLWGNICYSTDVKLSPFNQKYALIINKVVWYAVRLIVDLDERCDGGPVILKLNEHLTYSGAKSDVDKIIHRFEKLKEDSQSLHPFAGYYLIIPSDVHQNPDKYLMKGDFVFTKRTNALIKYDHAGIYAGDGMVIHVSMPEESQGEGKFKKESCIVKTKWDKFCANQSAEISVFLKLYKAKSHTDVYRTAESMIGARKGEYNFFKFNCQHFGSYCQSGIDFSPEVLECFSETYNFISRTYKLN